MPTSPSAGFDNVREVLRQRDEHLFRLDDEPELAHAVEALEQADEAMRRARAAAGRAEPPQLAPPPAPAITGSRAAAARVKSAARKSENAIAHAKARSMSWQNIRKEALGEARQLVASHLAELRDEELADAREASERAALYAEADARATKQGAALADALLRDVEALDGLALDPREMSDDEAAGRALVLGDDELSALELSLQNWTGERGDSAATASASSPSPRGQMHAAQSEWDGKHGLGDALRRSSLHHSLDLLSRAVDLPYAPWELTSQARRPWRGGAGLQAVKQTANAEALLSLRRAEAEVASRRFAPPAKLKAVTSMPALRGSNVRRAAPSHGGVRVERAGKRGPPPPARQPWQGGYHFVAPKDKVSQPPQHTIGGMEDRRSASAANLPPSSGPTFFSRRVPTSRVA